MMSSPANMMTVCLPEMLVDRVALQNIAANPASFVEKDGSLGGLAHLQPRQVPSEIVWAHSSPAFVPQLLI
eukprot:scaffold31151_cov23-Prasinocladus_malaysianus.AAC.1